ncbi:hypothetical protein NC796_07225 [Aliifodinibius sp. S!AR15-10]|uniref:hypothetical protein n=1 Tax=Aliifodinibius sp. S!AR15-10 TaxID=2950437 RepID=UPI002855CE32|nr:hypothetical protein [Aliifodinibius sp. S!AR15-10]MDR8390922.1 hypothetical protein [Aliifodinibius sp. S!AR15-10]
MIIITESFAQQAGDSDGYLKHQIGFNATESIRLFEEESDKTYKLYYRHKVNPTTAIRSGINYRMDSSGNSMLELDLKVGLDKEFKRSGNWRFYAGGDISGGLEKVPSSARRNYQLGLSPFIGFLYHIDEHFSISTEPGLLVELRRFKNTDTFNPDNSETWVEMDLINVGQLIIGIHF